MTDRRHHEWTGRCLHPFDDDGPCWRRHLLTGLGVWPMRLPEPDPAERHFIQWNTSGEFSGYTAPVRVCHFVKSSEVRT